MGRANIAERVRMGTIVHSDLRLAALPEAGPGVPGNPQARVAARSTARRCNECIAVLSDSLTRAWRWSTFCHSVLRGR